MERLCSPPGLYELTHTMPILLAILSRPPARTDARTAHSAAWARTAVTASVPGSTARTGAQVVDCPALGPRGDPSPEAFGAPERTAWTAYGLRAGQLPPLDADLFIAAGAVAAERAARDPVARVDLAGILRRALEQAAALRSGR